MSPEQASGRTDQIGARSDVISLRRILAEVVLGPPLAVGSGTHTESLSLPPSRCRELRCIVRHTTAEPAAARSATTAELAAALQRFLIRQPTIVAFHSAIKTPISHQYIAGQTAAAM